MTTRQVTSELPTSITALIRQVRDAIDAICQINATRAAVHELPLRQRRQYVGPGRGQWVDQGEVARTR
jgi:hypothetical protein